MTTSTGATTSGRLLQRLNLWEADTCALLEKAYKLAKHEEELSNAEQFLEIGNNRVPVLPSTRLVEVDDASSSSEDENDAAARSTDDDDDSEESESESDGGSEDEGPVSVSAQAPGNTPLETVAEGDDEEPDAAPNTIKSTSTSTNRNKKSKPPPTSKQQKRQAQLVKQHAANIMRVDLKLPAKDAVDIEGSEKHVYLCLSPPASLLPKPRPTTNVQIAQEYLQLSQNLSSSGKYTVILLLQSGRFAGGVFQNGNCKTHRALSQYTVRKGQGKAQSSMDGKRRPKSMGAQLRRAGEQALREDIHATLQEWQDYIQNACLILTACPKTMRNVIFESGEDTATNNNADSPLLAKDNPNVRKIPFDVGRPTFESVKVVHQVMMGVDVREVAEVVADVTKVEQEAPSTSVETKQDDRQQQAPASIDLPLTPLHHACKDGNLPMLLDLLTTLEPNTSDMNQPAGYDCMTPLHFASAATTNIDPVTAAACVSALLIQGHADPTLVDARDRPPYFLATHDKVREAFRKARAVLGEDYCDWDGAAKVGPALTEEDVAAKKEKEAEKKRRKKTRQKEKKAKEKAQAQEMEERRKAEEEEKQKVEEAKRIRDGLAGKPTGPNVCDYCQKVVKGKKRNQMFQRLDYKYCSSDCVNAHKRELMAAAAMARFG